jgi:hypothetical protein
MGIAAGKKNIENKVPEIKVAYATPTSDATLKNVSIPIHSHRSLFPRGFRNVKPTRKVGFFFSANIDGLTDYVIRHTS